MMHLDVNGFFTERGALLSKVATGFLAAMCQRTNENQ